MTPGGRSGSRWWFGGEGGAGRGPGNVTALAYLLDEADEAPPEAPGFVAVALQRAHSDLLRLLHCHGNHVHGVVHQRCVRLLWGGESLIYFLFCNFLWKGPDFN